MIGYFDAFLFALASATDMAIGDEQGQLRGAPSLGLIRSLRNVSMHHSILAAPGTNGKFERPFSRHLAVGNSGSSIAPARLAFRFDVLRAIFARVAEERPAEVRNIERALAVIEQLEHGSGGDVFVDDVMNMALAEAESITSRR